MQRIQRKRSRGWRMPKGAVYVGRPTKWGNPFTPEKYWDAGYSGDRDIAIRHCVEAFGAWMRGEYHWAIGSVTGSTARPDVSELRGKDLACWCPPGSLCHADVLIEIANQSGETGE